MSDEEALPPPKRDIMAAMELPPAAPERPLTREEIEAHFNRILLIARVAVSDTAPLAQILRLTERYNGIDRTFDPTAWMAKGQTVQHNAAIIRAYRDFQATLVKLLGPAIVAAIRRNDD